MSRRNAWRDVMRRFSSLRKSNGTTWAVTRALGEVGIPVQRFLAPEHVDHTALEAQVRGIFLAWGMPEDQVDITVPLLLYADAHGIESHGCGMLWDYHRGLRAGRLIMAPKVCIVRDDPNTALIDGGGGLGHVPAQQAMTLAIAKARASGVGVVSVRNSGHFGAAGAYAAMAAREGMIGVATTNTRLPALVPTFGLDAQLGTNPIAFAAPAHQERPFLLDMATTTAPVGRLMLAWRTGQRLPEGWALNEHGQPLTDPRQAAQLRRLTPLGSSREMGSHKGYGLATMVEILSAVLSGTRRHDRDRAPDAQRVGHLCMALDPKRFRTAGEFESDMDALIDDLRATPQVHANEPVLVAGDPEYAAADAVKQTGTITLSRMLYEDLREICATSGAAFLLETSPLTPEAR